MWSWGSLRVALSIPRFVFWTWSRERLLPESMYPSYGPNGWAKDNKSFFYDASKITDIKSPEIELNRQTRLHKLGTDVTTDIDFFSNESNPELGITPKEFPEASINESSPDYIIGEVGTVQNEMRIFYAPASELHDKKIKWDVLCTPSDKLVRGFTTSTRRHVCAITHAGARPNTKSCATNVQHPDWEHAEGSDFGRA